MEEEKASVLKAIKLFIWGQVIFITDQKSLTAVTKVLSHEMHIPEIRNEKDEGEKQKKRLQWIGMTRDVVDQQQNRQRSYSSGEVSNFMVQYMMMEEGDDEMGGSKAMTIEEVELCALHDEKFCKSESLVWNSCWNSWGIPDS